LEQQRTSDALLFMAPVLYYVLAAFNLVHA
jgi:hypothetical protein